MTPRERLISELSKITDMDAWHEETALPIIADFIIKREEYIVEPLMIKEPSPVLKDEGFEWQLKGQPNITATTKAIHEYPEMFGYKRPTQVNPVEQECEKVCSEVGCNKKGVVDQKKNGWRCEEHILFGTVKQVNPPSKLVELDYVEVMEWANNNGHLQYKYLRSILRDLCSTFATSQPTKERTSVQEIEVILTKFHGRMLNSVNDEFIPNGTGMKHITEFAQQIASHLNGHSNPLTKE